MKKGGFGDMISTVKREIAIEKELRSKIEWACTFSNCEPKIKNGNLRMVEKTNIAYVEPHSVVIKGKLYLFCSDSFEGTKSPAFWLNANTGSGVIGGVSFPCVME